MRTIFTAIALIMAFSITSAFAGAYDDGLANYYRGDFEKAIPLISQAADESNGEAQYLLGKMYSNGQGVAVDHAKAYQWYQKAAEQKNPDAQYGVGMSYMFGRGVARDIVKAYAWGVLADYNRAQDASILLQIAKKGMSEEALAAANKAADELIAKYGR